MLRSFGLILLLGCYSLALALEPLHNTASRFHATQALHGVVAAQEQRAADVGVQMMQQGGNAVDAAVATAFALMVTLPRAGSLGGGGFAMLAMPSDAFHPKFIDFREVAPKLSSPTMMLNAQGQLDVESLRHSWLSVGVPGNVAGLCYLEAHYGRLTLTQVIQPAITMAAKGIAVKPYLANALHHYRPLLVQNATTRMMLSRPDGSEYQLGDQMKRPDLAQSLQLIQQHGAQVFYTGSLARKIAQASESAGGLMRMDDLKQYRVIERQPVHQVIHGYHVYAAPPPSSGGVAMLQVLQALNYFDFGRGAVMQNTAQAYHLLAELFNRVFLDRNQYLGDPDFVENPTKQLLSHEHIQSIAQSINTVQHTSSDALIQSKSISNEGHNTTHISVLDQDGGMVALTYSINYSYGSGITVPGTGILLNNTMLDFTLQPPENEHHQVVLGLNNRIAPQKRPLSSMSPVIVFNQDGTPWLATGSPGGQQIITCVTQLLTNILLYHMPLAEATEAPRIHTQLFPDVLLVESGISPDSLALLKKMGHLVQLSRSMGSLQSVMKTSHGRWGFSDSRRAGAGVAVY